MQHKVIFNETLAPNIPLLCKESLYLWNTFFLLIAATWKYVACENLFSAVYWMLKKSQPDLHTHLYVTIIKLLYWYFKMP